VKSTVAMPIGEHMTMPHGVSKHVQHLTGQALCCKPLRIIKRIQFSKNPSLIERLMLNCKKWAEPQQKQNCTHFKQQMSKTRC